MAGEMAKNVITGKTKGSGNEWMGRAKLAEGEGPIREKEETNRDRGKAKRANRKRTNEGQSVKKPNRKPSQHRPHYSRQPVPIIHRLFPTSHRASPHMFPSIALHMRKPGSTHSLLRRRMLPQ